MSGNVGRVKALTECEHLMRIGSPNYPCKRAVALARYLLQQGHPPPDRKRWPLTIELMRKVNRKEKLK
jgi:hypothetical protein